MLQIASQSFSFTYLITGSFPDPYDAGASPTFNVSSQGSGGQLSNSGPPVNPLVPGQTLTGSATPQGTNSYTGYSYNGGIIGKNVNGGQTSYYLYSNVGGLSSGSGTLTSSSSGTINSFCFLAGTHISTLSGEVLVENLKIGDIVSTADGGTRKVLWVGEQKISTVFGSPKNYPVEICISALGDNLPKRPLRVSPGHSLLIDGAFPIASALINGYTVRKLTKDELPEVFTYYHVEVEDHALILAEGVPAETFLDAWSRRAFSNWQEYVELYGEEERNVPPSDLHYQRVLKFHDLPQSLKDTLGEPLDAVGEEAA